MSCADCEKVRKTSFLMVMFFVLCAYVGILLFLYPTMQKEANCKNACNEQITKILEQCIPKFTAQEGNESPFNLGYPPEGGEYVYVDIEDMVKHYNSTDTEKEG